VLYLAAARWALAGVLERRGADGRADDLRADATTAAGRLGVDLSGSLVRLY